MMRKLLLITILFLLGTAAVQAQYSEKDILSQQAYQFLARRQFSDAEELFKTILERYPTDNNSVLQLMQIYFQTSQLDKAESTLEQYRRALFPNQVAELEIQLLIMQGKPDPAWTLGQAYLEQRHNQNAYRILASYFERRGFFEQVLQLYQQARQQHNNNELFMLEIANTALNFRQFTLALQEYLRFLDKNPANLFFINNQVKTILSEDSTMIAVVGEQAKEANSQIINELYANALISQRRHEEALEIYKLLPEDKLLRFAEDQYLALNDEVALPAFAYLSDSTSDPIRSNEHRFRVAQIQFRNRRHDETKLLLEQIIGDSLLLEPRNRLRSPVNLNARKLMAHNSIALHKDIPAAVNWLQEAKQFCRNNTETQEIELALTRLNISAADYATAHQRLASITDKNHFETRNFLRFTAYLMQGETELADSLMNEYIIQYPSGKYVNDSIYLMMFVLGLQGADREIFFQAYRLMQLQDGAAVDSLLSLFARTGDEELLILAVEWSILLADQSRALEILQREWEDGICAEYAALLKLTLIKDPLLEQRLAREFLKSNPDSIFSPKFRQQLSRLNQSRPEY